jgi:hypothetical protein
MNKDLAMMSHTSEKSKREGRLAIEVSNLIEKDKWMFESEVSS